MREFISYTFTTKTTSELFAGIPQNMQTRIRRGEVVPGMSIKAVMLAYGPPPACRTTDLRHGTWIYWRTSDSIIRLVMRDDRVRAVLDLEQDK
jgi:hypothetical protein